MEYVFIKEYEICTFTMTFLHYHDHQYMQLSYIQILIYPMV